MLIRVVMAAMLLFACQISEKAGEVKSSGDEFDKFQNCIEAITQNQEDTLRETHDDPSCELTESNCINDANIGKAKLNYQRRSLGDSDAVQMSVMNSEMTGIYQRFAFSDIKACKCMKDNNMTIGFRDNTGEVRVGLGKFSASSDRYTLEGVKDVHIQLLPDSEEVKPHTYHYCRLKITGYRFTEGTYNGKHDFLGDDGNLEPQENSKLVDGFVTAEGDMHDKITPLQYYNLQD